MPKVPAITEAEWDVMQVLWDDAPLAAQDVHQRLGEKRDWSPRTVKTLLGRLVRKRALTYREDGKRYLYRPKVSREACLRHASRSFLETVFAGDAAMLVTHLVRHSRMSRDDIESLKQILDDKEH